jgi:hypothetical protein
MGLDAVSLFGWLHSLVFQEEVVFEQGEVWRNPKVRLTEMDKNGDLKNRVRVQMDQLNLIVVKKSSEEIASRESKPTLEERRKHHNLVLIGGGNGFSSSGLPLQHGAIGKKVICIKFANPFFVYDRRLEDVGMRGYH